MAQASASETWRVGELEVRIVDGHAELPDAMVDESGKLLEAAFNGCRSLTSLTLPTSLVEISPCAFYGCSSLKALSIPSSCKTIGELAFWVIVRFLFANPACTLANHFTVLYNILIFVISQFDSRHWCIVARCNAIVL